MDDNHSVLAFINVLAQQSGLAGITDVPWVWPMLESMHFFGLSLLIGTVGLFDLRLLGIAKRISPAALHRLVPYGVLGYGINLVTGLLFFLSAPDQYLYNPAFQLKLVFMLIAGLNMVLFYQTAFATLPTYQQPHSRHTNAQIAAAVSLSCWLAVIICGRLITFYRPPFFWCWWCS